MVNRFTSSLIHWPSILVLITILLGNCFTAHSQSLSKYRSHSVDVNGIERDYFIYVPETKSGYFDLPLVLNFHGYGLSAQDQIERSDMSALAQKEHFVVVYPQGSYLNGKRHWRVGSYTRASRAEDIAFVEELIDHLSEELPIDKDKVYACGFSNGGYFSLRLACTRPDLIAAAASVGGTMSQENYDGCLTSRGVPVFLINGSQDAIVPLQGKSAKGYMPIKTVIQKWCRKNDCNYRSNQTFTLDCAEQNNVERIRYLDGNGTLRVQQDVVQGGGHEWLDVEGCGYNASRQVWLFLRRFSK